MSILRSYYFPLAALGLSLIAFLLQDHTQALLVWIRPALIAAPLSFLLGLKASRNHLRSSFHDPRSFILTLIWIFFVFPLVNYGLLQSIALLFPRIAERINAIVILSISVIPSTVATCILMTIHAGGNGARSASISVFSNFLGTFMTPFLLGILFHAGHPDTQFFFTVLPSLLFVCVPYCIACGIRIACEKRWSVHADKICTLSCNALVLLNIFLIASRAEYSTLHQERVTLLFLFCAYPFIVALSLYAAKLFRMSFESRVSFVMVGNQKSLSLGFAIFGIYYRGSLQILAALGAVFVLFNIWQFFVTGILQGYYRAHLIPKSQYEDNPR